MTPPGDLLPWVGLACTIACLLTALIGRWRRWAVGAAMGVFVLALFVPPPLEAARSAAMGLHPFPVSFLNLILAGIAMVAGSVLRLVALGVLTLVRR